MDKIEKTLFGRFCALETNVKNCGGGMASLEAADFSHGMPLGTVGWSIAQIELFY